VDEATPINPAALDNLLQMLGGDPVFLAEMIDSYLADTPGQLAAMREALEAGNSEVLQRSAHSLRSTSINFGAERLVELCQQLEDLARSGALDDAPARLAHAETEFGRVRRALDLLRPSSEESG
jgi:two-component system sensor histidine kinase/response regulator